MFKPSPEKVIAKLEAKMDADLKALGLDNLDQFDNMADHENMDFNKYYPDILRACFDASDDTLVSELSALISNGADVNEQSAYGKTPVRQTFARSHFDAMRLLIEISADKFREQARQRDVKPRKSRCPILAGTNTNLSQRL